MAQISVDRALEMAVAHHRAGRWRDAEAIYRQILAQLPDHALAMHQLAVLLAQQSRHEEATPLFARVIQLQPDSAEAHNDLGSVLRSQGRLTEAAAALSRAIILKPDLALAHGNLANVHRDMGKLDEAIQGFQRAIQIKPDYAAAFSNLGNALCDQGRLEESVAAFRRAVQLDPAFATAHNNLGVALDRLHRSEEAVASLQRAVQLAPDYASAFSNLGSSLLKNRKVEPAIAAFRRAIQLQPGVAESHNNLGNALGDRGDLEGAIESYRHALRLKPDYPEAMNNLAGALIDQGKLDEPEGLFRRAIELNPQMPDAHWNLAIFLLLHGDFARGLPEYEWRWKVKGMAGPPPFPQPLWDGRALNGQTILLHAEQGIGDAIQFIRYTSMVAARGGRITLRCAPELQRLFAVIPEIQEMTTPNQPLPDFDFHCPLLSLPLMFKTDLHSIPAPVPYLRADPSQADFWKNKLAGRGDAGKIGLAWAGSATHPNDRNRSTTLGNFAPLSRVNNAVFYSLQKGEAGGHLPPAGLSISNFTSELSDLADTAALIQNLDLVITVDTSIAHLAGAMGKPVWVILPSNPDWRWMYNRTDSPWYPTMRLFRQRKPNDWTAMLEEIVLVLRDAGDFGTSGAILCPKG